MRSETQVLALLNDNTLFGDNAKVSDAIKKGREAFIGISLHTRGATPKFEYEGNTVLPPGWMGEAYHYRYDTFLINRHPRESVITRNWRFSQVKPFTKAPFLEIIETLTGAIFQDSNWNIDVPGSEVDRAYLYENRFSGKDLVGYYQEKMQAIMEDANGYFVRIPSRPYYEQQGEKVDVDIWFVQITDVLLVNSEEILFQRGDEVYLINTVAILRFRKKQSENAGRSEWENADGQMGGYFAHKLGRMPIDIAGGIWNNAGYNESYLAKAQPVADEYITSKSAEQLVNKEASHPWVVMVEEDCPTCNAVGKIKVPCKSCENGLTNGATCIPCGGHSEVLDTCPTCKGGGQISRNPGEILYAPKAEMQLKYDQIKIINPDVSINTYHRDSNKGLYEQLLDALHLLKTMEAQSGVAKALDQEQLYLFVLRVCNDLFDRIIYNTVRDILQYRNLSFSESDFVIVKPAQFQIKTAEDLLSEYDAATKSGLPTYVRQRMLIDYTGKQFGGDVVMQRKSLLINTIDPLSAHTTDEVASELMSGIFTVRDAKFSRMLPGILDTLVREKGAEWFLGADVDVVTTAAQAKFAVLAPTEPQPYVPPPANN
jgi:hypothetical protein